ncbi:MAG: HlyD family secretion protein [Hyphomonadaceae bacterium]
MPDDAGHLPQAGRATAKVAPMARVIGKRVLFAAGALIALGLLSAWGVNWYREGRFLVSTENAYVRADISLVSAQIEGYVRALPAAENQAVHTGDTLVEIEPADYRARLSAARAVLAQAEGELASQRAQQAQARADLNRNTALFAEGFLSQAGLDAATARAQQATGGEAAALAAVAAARAQIETAELDLERTVVRAPIDGVVGDRQVQLGQLVRSGAPLMSVVPLQSVYVVANFKETQIARFRAGQAVTVRPDIAHDLRLRGEIESLAPASGTEFSIIPTDTATGNFTKIVQRVPVRIRLTPGQEGISLLRPGLSVTVTVDTRG